MRYQKTHAIVLYARKTGEHDKYVHLFSMEMGKVKALATGSRKITAKLLAATEPVTETEFMLYLNSRTSRVRIVGGVLKDMFSPLKTDIRRYSCACAVVNLVDSLTPEHEKDIHKYLLLKRTLELLETSSNPGRIYLAFAVRFMKICGYGLDLNKCASCKTEIPYGEAARKSGIISFSLKDKGLVCSDCYNENDFEPVNISPQALQFFRQLSKLPGEDVDRLEVSGKTEELVDSLIRNYLREFLPYSLKTQMFVKRYTEEVLG